MTAVERVEGSARIAARLDQEALAGINPGGVVGLYAAKGSEVETAGIDAAARARGLRVAYPRVAEGDRVLDFCEVLLEELVVGRFGLREPPPGAPVIGVEDIAMFVVPGLAFDRRGGRLGWGHGHYDATLARGRAEARRVGVAFECQIVELIESEPHDAPMHLIVTEVATHVV